MEDYDLGLQYFYGEGVKQDYVQATNYKSEAAHLWHPNSQAVLGEMYMEGFVFE